MGALTPKKLHEALCAPFPPEAISWRAQNVSAETSKALALAYIDARDVMERLDAVCGADGWQDSYEETPRGRLISTISIKFGDQWVAKSDGAGDTAVEGEKGAISDAYKRAAVKWGIGRYLYNTPTIWAPCITTRGTDQKVRWKAWKPEAADMFAKALKGIAPPETKEDAHSALQAEVRAFVREMESCGDWDTWAALRETKDAKRIIEECEAKLPHWFDGWPEQPDGFIPLRRRIEDLERTLANHIADIARA